MTLEFLSMLEYERFSEIHGYVHPHYHTPTRKLAQTVRKYQKIKSRAEILINDVYQASCNA